MRWIILLIALVAVIAFVAVYMLRISEKKVMRAYAWWF